MNGVYEEQKKFFNYIEHSINNNKVSHAYLIETNSYPNYTEVIKEFIKVILIHDIVNQDVKEKIKFQVDNNIYPDIEIINPDGNNIKKEQLIKVEQDYSKRSMSGNKQIYVINDASKLNQSSANTILKFLEEPPENIIAILVVSNKYNVIDTIVSRCQCLSLKNDYNEEQEKNEILSSFVDSLNDPRKLIVNYDSYFNELFLDKNKCASNLKSIEQELHNQLLKSSKKSQTEKYISIVENEIANLQYNVNLKLWYTSFLCKLLEVMN